MIKIAVLSDTHGNKNGVDNLIEFFKECVYIIHLGDGYEDMEDISHLFGPKVIQVMGNCDIMYPRVDESFLTLDGVKMFFTHGHRFHVKQSLDYLISYGKMKGINIIFYGHTHRREIKEINGIVVANPGSLSYYGDKYGFLLLEINNGEYKIKEINA